MATKVFLKLDEVKGDSRNSQHFDEIEIIEWKFGSKYLKKAVAAGAAQAGIYSSSSVDLSITKNQDSASQTLMNSLIFGNWFNEGVLTMEMLSKVGNFQRAIVFRLKNVKVISISNNGRGSEGKSEIEFIDFRIEQLKTYYL